MNIVFVKTGSHSLFGSFSAGDTMRCDEQLANQLINAGLAEDVSIVGDEQDEADSEEVHIENELTEDVLAEEVENVNESGLADD